MPDQICAHRICLPNKLKNDYYRSRRSSPFSAAVRSRRILSAWPTSTPSSRLKRRSHRVQYIGVVACQVQVRASKDNYKPGSTSWAGSISRGTSINSQICIARGGQLPRLRQKPDCAAYLQQHFFLVASVSVTVAPSGKVSDRNRRIVHGTVIWRSPCRNCQCRAQVLLLASIVIIHPSCASSHMGGFRCESANAQPVPIGRVRPRPTGDYNNCLVNDLGRIPTHPSTRHSAG